ncbi:MAG TPA: ABC transporter permease, partial [Cytophagales bacterium]|nr:ABC transporter permease [Cytophagales bacterium]
MANASHFPYFISKRIRSKATGRFSATIQRIGIGSIAVGLAVMIVSQFILGGFRETIQEKIFSFGAHVLVTKYSNSNSYDENPVEAENHLYLHPEEYEYVEHVQPFSNKAALLKTDEEVQGVIMKGVNPDFDTARFAPNLLEGRFIEWKDSTYAEEILISRKLANLLRLSVNDRVLVYFVQNPPRTRRVTVVGIYSTSMEDFDDKFILGDLGLLQHLNNWGDSLVGGFEVYLTDFDDLQEGKASMLSQTDYNLSVQGVTDRYPQLFDWLMLLDRNELILLVIVLFVASFNMISILLILIMERTSMIGLLKALGTTDGQIRNIFLYNAQYLIVRGLAWGNGLALLIAFLQYQFQIIPLDPENYYMEYVPILWDWPA